MPTRLMREHGRAPAHHPTASAPSQRCSGRLKRSITNRDAYRHDITVQLVLVISAALLLGCIAAWIYYQQQLTLSHYDAKAHLVVARRILDSLRPGWKQIGAVWLPLPHLLNALPAQNDWLYRTGVSAVALSVFGFVLGSTSLWWLVARATGSLAAAWSAFAVFAAHPDVLYLQATPMTESLLMGFCIAGIAHAYTWTARGGAGAPWTAGAMCALACLTRYEAWPVTAAAVGAAAVALIRLGAPPGYVVRRVAMLAVMPVLAVGSFMLLSHATVWAWLVTGGFYEVDASTYHLMAAALSEVGDGVRLLNGRAMSGLALVGFGLLLFASAKMRTRSALVVVAALAACLVLPTYAFWNGHPVRLRYMVPMTMAVAAFAGIGVGLLGRGRHVAAGLVILTSLVETPPFARQSPIVVESQRDRSNVVERRRVTECLQRSYDDTLILASMGSLAHYMHETSSVGLYIRNFIHEGTGQLWIDSLASARAHAGWVLLEEQAEGGDVLSKLSVRVPAYLDGFERICEAGGVALYRRGLID
jgi:hypothetical protein